MTGLRTLPLCVQVAPGESVDSWLEALARRYRVPPRAMLPLLGIEPVVFVSTLLAKTLPETWERAGATAGLGPAALRAAAGEHRKLLPALPGAGSRYCPRCLAENGGRWLLEWRSRWFTACRRHQVWLAERCPQCQAPVRTKIAAGHGPVPPATCTRALDRRRRCGAVLTETVMAGADPAALETQRWIEGLVGALGGADADNAEAALADLPTITSWLARTTLPGPEPHEPAGRARAAVPDTDPATTAHLLTQARSLLTGSDQAAIDAIRHISAGSPTGFGNPPPGMGTRRWRALGPVFPGRYLRAADPHLNAGDRLRTKSMTPGAARPGGASRDRDALVPQLLWPEWSARMLPPAGFHAEKFRAVIAATVLVPGSTERGYAEIAAPLNPHLYPASITMALKTLTDIGAQTYLHPTLVAIARLADHLDQHGGAIDYRRRRQITTALTLTWTQWRDLACGAGAHPGDNSPTGRILQARRHLHQMLTGDDLTNPAHPLALRTAAERTQYLAFTAGLTPTLRRAFYQRAEQFLADHAIDEPVAWHPPLTLLRGLHLPGIDLDRVDLDLVKRIVIDELQPPRNAARALGIHLEHVRFALERIERPERVFTKGAPLAWHREQELTRILTPEYFQREYVEARRPLREIAQSLGTTRAIVTDHAHRHGIDTDQAPRKTTPIDEAWLRKRYERDQHSTGQIADELGVTQMIVNRAAARIGVRLRPAGITSHPQMLTTLDRRLPRDIRQAVDASLHGWTRLRRFQIAMALPSLDETDRYLGKRRSALTTQLQRLENDIGDTLYTRSAIGKPHTPTPRGRKLLHALQRPTTQAHMAQALGPHLEPMPDQATIDAATTRFHTPPKKPGPKPLHPFTDIRVEPIHIGPATLRLLQDLLAHDDHQFYGEQIRKRAGIDTGTLYPALHRLHTAGWLTSWPENEQEWLSGAPPGRGPGRRRTYYALTPEGRRAAQTEIANHTTRPKKVPKV